MRLPKNLQYDLIVAGVHILDATIHLAAICAVSFSVGYSLIRGALSATRHGLDMAIVPVVTHASIASIATTSHD